MHKFGLDDMKSFGDSTGEFAHVESEPRDPAFSAGAESSSQCAP